jgi:type I pantothenate kinase
VLLGISGGVGVGKTTAAARVCDALASSGERVEVLCTDCFLFPNAVLEARQLGMRKGFPESFDVDALETCLAAIAAGEAAVQVPVYSHATYDRDPTRVQVVEPAAQVVIVEGVNALQPPVADHLDLAVYLDADETDMEAWFVERFLAFCAEGRGFYRGFATMSVAQQRGVAEWTWREINAVNLRDHIAPSRARATHVFTKRRDHSVSRVRP